MHIFISSSFLEYFSRANLNGPLLTDGSLVLDLLQAGTMVFQESSISCSILQMRIMGTIGKNCLLPNGRTAKNVKPRSGTRFRDKVIFTPNQQCGGHVHNNVVFRRMGGGMVVENVLVCRGPSGPMTFAYGTRERLGCAGRSTLVRFKK